MAFFSAFYLKDAALCIFFFLFSFSSSVSFSSAFPTIFPRIKMYHTGDAREKRKRIKRKIKTASGNLD